jgi:hypothetical protein
MTLVLPEQGGSEDGDHCRQGKGGRILAERMFARFRKEYCRLVGRWERLAACFDALPIECVWVC